MSAITRQRMANIFRFLLQNLPLCLVAVFVIYFFQTFQLLAHRWIKWDESLSHGFLVIAGFLFLIHKSLPWNIQQQPRWLFWLFAVFIGLLSIAWFIFEVININLFEQLILLPLFWLMIAAIFGYRLAWKHRVLLIMPVFALPIWNQLNAGLLDISVFVVGGMVRQWQMTALIEGNSIFIPYGHILIADGCSGLRYFVIALAIGYILSYLNHYRTRELIVTLMIAAVIGLAANWIRIFILILIGYNTQMQSSLMQDHELFGWIIFALMCLPAIYLAPVVHCDIPKNSLLVSPKDNRRIPIVLLVLALGPLASLVFNAAPTPSVFKLDLPANYRPQQASRMPVVVTAPERGQHQTGVAFIDDTEVYLQINLYNRVNRNDKLVPYIGHLYNPDEWLATHQTTNGSGPGKLTQLKFKNGFQQVMQLQWFKLGNHQTGSERTAKLLQIPALFSNTNDFLIFTLQARCQATDCSKAEAALLQASRNFYPQPSKQ